MQRSSLTALKNDVAKITDISSMSDHEVRESVVTTKEWKKELKSLQDLKEKLDVDMVSIIVDDEVKHS